MEILSWLGFFILMITLSFFSWTELCGIFFGTIAITGGILNYEEFKKSNNVFKSSLSYLIKSFKFIKMLFKILSKKIIKTTIGFYLYYFLVFLENSYQDLKTKLRNYVIKVIFTSVKMGIPRFSLDEDDTDDED